MAELHEQENRRSAPDHGESPSTSEPRDVGQELASGRPASTPFALTGIVAIVVWSAAAVVAAVLFLVIWLA
jgi:hypothetical protein